MRKKNTLLLLLLIGVLASCQSNKSSDRVFNIVDYGAKGDSLTDNVEAIQEAIDACNKAGGGQVVIPSGGVYMTSPITLASFVDLHVEANAKLLANPKESVYTKSAFKDNRGEGMMWISGENIEDVSISGQGEINGNGVAFMGKELSDSYELKPVHEFDPRPHLITIIGGKNIRIQDVNITNSAYWALHLVGCNDVVVQGITLLNNLKVRNGDGIDVDHSKNVRISDCYIESGDDCICLKNRREYEEWGPCENISVTNCIMTSRSCVPPGPRYVDPGAAATGELIYELAFANQWRLDATAARALYVALMTDTGGFRFSNTHPRTLRVAADLLETGIDPESIYLEVYANAPEGRPRLLAEALQTLVVESELGLAWVTIPPGAIERYGLTADDLEGIVEHPRSIAGMRLAILFREVSQGRIKVSLRSVGEVDVAEFAHRFGGGGHAKAAGAALPGSMAEVQALILAAARDYLAGSSPR